MENFEVEEKQHGSPRRSILDVARHNKWKTFFLLIALYLGIEVAALPYGDIERLKATNPTETAFMQFAANAAVANGRKFKKRQTWVPFNRIPSHAVQAVVVAEDGTFWSHDGFDWFEFRESFWKNIKEFRFSRGASTITQQLVKNLYLSPSKNPVRKLKEWILTWKMENTLSKSRILEIYLNVIEWGDGIYGIEAASQQYFGKSASELTREEGARLAAVIPSPKRYRADSDSRAVVRRKDLVLARMNARGWVDGLSEPDSVGVDSLGMDSLELPLDSLAME
ncbi:MAG: monofunctional biosynthetic peptidoglycan transglycosylase [Ignavibacteriae bacterium]|nr:monofunctional biosynthetic peptidoglycan transglycosylase [Ignavibacteriota bacterium]